MGNETPNRGSSETPPRPPTLKDLDVPDRLYLKQLLKAQGENLASDSDVVETPISRLWQSLKIWWQK